MVGPGSARRVYVLPGPLWANMQITESMYALLEQHHGAGNVIVVSVGVEDYAFRRPEQTQVTYALDCIGKKMLSAREELALGCLITADGPSANAIGQKPTAEDKQALDAEKVLVASLLEGAQSFRDDLGFQFCWAIGSAPKVDCAPLSGDHYKVTVSPNPTAAELFGLDWGPVELIAHKPSRSAYERFRLLTINGAEGEAEQYAFDTLVESATKADFSRRYPLAVIAVGNFLPTLGTDGRSVRIKKFKAGLQTPDSSSTDMPAPAATSP